MAFYGRVLDVSNVNPSNLTRVRASHCKALICKATEGETFKDSHLPVSRQYAKKLKRPFGSYLFLRPGKSGVGQAAAYLNYARPRRGDVQPIIDAEVYDGLGIGVVARCVDECARTLEKGGYRPILYASTSFLFALYNVRPGLRRLHVWQAEYPSWLPHTVKARLARRTRIKRGVTVVMWQYTSRWPIIGRRFDGSYLLQPVDHLLINPGL